MSQLAKVFTRSSTGLDAPVVTIEVHISGPLLDRIDMVLEVPPLPKEVLLKQKK